MQVPFISFFTMASANSFPDPLKATGNQKSPPQNIPQPYFKLVLQSTKCMASQYGHCSPKSNYSFTIHGVWPNHVREIELNHSENTFSKGQLKEANLLKKLEEFWPSLNPNSSNLEFWQNEWNNHGRLTNLPAQEFFEKSITKPKYYIEKFSENKRLNMANEFFKFSELYDILEKIIGKKIQIRLIDRPEGGYTLWEVVIFLNLRWETIDRPQLFPSSVCDRIINDSDMVYFEA